MENKVISTNFYLLQGADDNSGFGYIYGLACPPDYATKVKLYIKDDRFEPESDLENSQLVVLDRVELESISKAAQYVNNSLDTLISLAKRNLLKDECFEDV